MKKVAKVLGGLVLATVLVVAMLNMYFRWENPIGWHNLKICKAIKPGISIEQLIAELGEPTHRSSSDDITSLYLQTPSLAAGPITAIIQDGKVIRLRCNEDGPDTWSLPEGSGSK